MELSKNVTTRKGALQHQRPLPFAKPLSAGCIDGFIFADAACDPIVKDLKLSKIKRELYHRFDVKIILPKGEHGKNVDNMLTAAIDNLKSTGEYNKIMGILDMPFDNWQP
jgi:polar amino acid transport system substrate-binding protein